MLKKSAVPVPPSLKEEAVPVQELGGSVLVRGLLLKDRIELAITDGYGRMAAMLAACVLVDGEPIKKGEPAPKVPLYTQDEWERWGAAHYIAAMTLWEKARQLSDLDGEAAAKNSTAQKSDSPAVSH